MIFVRKREELMSKGRCFVYSTYFFVRVLRTSDPNST